MSLQVCIMAPNRIFWNEEATELILPTNTGQMGILTNHTSLVTGLDVGVMLVRTGTEWFSIALMGGFALIKENRITILANEVELGSTINTEEAEVQFLAAQENYEKADGRKQKIEATLLLKRAKVRYQIKTKNI